MVPDYYAMLGVDPSCDRAAIEAALARCQPAWSSGTRNPKNKHKFQSYLDQIPALRRALLSDPTTRAAFDAELSAARRAEIDRKLDQLQKLLRLRAAKGGLTVSDRTLLREKAVEMGLTADDLDRLAESVPPKPEAPVEEDAPDPPLDVIDSATRRQIHLALEHLRKRDLYDVLGLPRDTPAQEVLAQADAERQRWMQKAHVTAEKTAWLEAVSYAQSHLGSPESRARYDRTLAFEAEESFQASASFALKGMARLDLGTKAALIDEATGLGIDPERANRLIGRACRSLGVALDGAAAAPASQAPLRLLRCRACSGVTDFLAAARARGAAACRHCGASLRWECPVCQSSHWVDEPTCACGFPQGLREPLVKHFEAAQHAHRARDYTSALEHLQRVQDFAPHHVGARKGIQKVREQLAEIERARSACESEQARRHLVAARAAVESWARLVDPSSPDLRAAWTEINRGLREALDLASKGKALAATDPRRARDLYRQSLAMASDLPEARDGLRRCPPDPPSALSADIGEGRVRLRWTAPTPDGLGPVTYLVVRKRQVPPAHAADGVAVCECSSTECDDLGAPSGETVGYAVFSRRAGADSLSGASAGPLLFLADVADVRVEVGRREVLLEWVAPPGILDVRVVRKVGSPPTGPGDGRAIEALRDRALDRSIREDEVCHYGIYARYRTPGGQVVTSQGIVVAALAQQPIEPPGPLTIAQEPDGRLRLAWPEPSRGRVEVLRTLKPHGLPRGERLTSAQAKALDGLWLDPMGGDSTFDPRPLASGVCYYTPLASWAGHYTVGSTTLFSCVPDPADLRAVRVGNQGRVHLRWRWSAQGSQSLVLAKSGSPPVGPDDPEAMRFTVQDVEYSRLGYYVLNLPPESPGPWHLGVHSVVNLDGDPIVSPGLEPTARTIVPGPHPEVTVSYALRPPRFPGRPWSLTFRTDPPGSPIPPTALVAHPRAVPLSVDDGQIIDQFPAARDGATFRVRRLGRLSPRRARVFADPHADPDGLPPIRLRHPEVEGTRV